jgi:hypothetical protein
MYSTGTKFPSKPHFFDATADVIDLVSKTKAIVQEKDKLENGRNTRSCLHDIIDCCDSTNSHLS